jgi:O-antigen ligase
LTASAAPIIAGENTMSTNIGGLDRLLRAAVGIVLIALTLSGTIGVWGWLGLVPLVTAVIGWCPAYRLLGMNTCPLKK